MVDFISTNSRSVLRQDDRRSEMDELAGLVEQVAIFYRRHVDGHGAGACVDLLSWLESAWPEIPKVSLPFEEQTDPDPASLGLGMIRDVGELARMLLDAGDPERALGWARANLIIEVGRYRDTIA
jgi:hypothetical protein